MSWNWLTGFLNFEESPPEPLVLGAELWCPYGSKHNFLMLETDYIDINNLPKAYVDDCKAFVNIDHFGECYGGLLCEDKMKLASRWENPEPQNVIVNGKEIITTKSTLLCMAEGIEIHVATSGQEKTFARQMALFMELEEKYPGLHAILTDPYGSLYLNEGMYEKAIAFLEDQMAQKGGEIFLPTIYDRNNPEGEMIRAALERLLPDCDASAFDHFMNGLETTGVLNGMDEVKGWDAHYLNKEMIEMLRKDCAATDEKIKTDSFARWTEEHKIFTSTLADTVTQLASAVVMYRAMQAKPMEKTGENPLGQIKDKIKNKVGKGDTATINPNEIRYSQSSVNGSSEIIDSMKQNGWKGDPIDVVEMPDGVYTTIDNTRVVSAREAGIDVQATIHNYNDPLPIEYVERFTAKQGVPTTWGEAIELRIGKQKASFRNTNPFGSFEMENIK